MKTLLLSAGTHGDMEPFLAVGELLKAKGVQVLCAFPEQFRVLAEESGPEFFSLGEEFIELPESDTGKAAMGGSCGFRRFVALIQLAGQQNKINRDLVNDPSHKRKAGQIARANKHEDLREKLYKAIVM